MSNFETWWEREGQEFLFALNTTTDDDIKLVAEIAWKNGAYCTEQAEQKPVSPYKPLPEEIWSKPFSSGAVSVPAQQAEPPVRTKDYNPDVIFNDDGTFSLTLPDGDELRIIPPQQEPTAEVSEEGYAWGKDGILPAGSLLYAAPVRTKYLTDDEIMNVWVHTIGKHPIMQFARAVIAADREKNK